MEKNGVNVADMQETRDFCRRIAELTTTRSFSRDLVGCGTLSYLAEVRVLSEGEFEVLSWNLEMDSLSTIFNNYCASARIVIGKAHAYSARCRDAELVNNTRKLVGYYGDFEYLLVRFNVYCEGKFGYPRVSVKYISKEQSSIVDTCSSEEQCAVLSALRRDLKCVIR